ncbi:unnamed protein product [Meganyctiphanes norvegica]|uniref:Uncharacterized protein n=1 Tax=Meganyctiphanes norvegica TaxID=48144 RepID=A0AAV2QKH9_MEGNR
MVKKCSSKRHGQIRDDLVTVKSDLKLLAHEEGEEQAKLTPQLKRGSRKPVPTRGHHDDAEDPITVLSPKSSHDGPGSGAKRAAVVMGKLGLLLVFLYFFICSLNLLASAFRLIGGKTASEVFQKSDLLSNPVVGLMMGVLVTVLVQSSSTSSSIIVSMVAANFLDVHTAIPLIMGANIGTSVTNTLVSFGQVADRDQFERAFSGAIVHDMFNWLCVLVMLPLESLTGYLYYSSEFLLSSFQFEQKDMKVEILSKITKPFTNVIVKIDKKVLTGWAMNDTKYENATLLKRFCPGGENTTETITCPNLAAQIPLDDLYIGLILLAVSLFCLCTCLISIVKILSSMLKGSVSGMVEKVLNDDIPRCPWLTGYLAIIFGAILTFILQSSSIFTSTLTPLVGLGIISVDRMYPLTLGSNLGTTTTAMLAALASDSNKIHAALQVALVHLMFNLTGLLLFYPIPFTRFPIGMAKAVGKVTAEYRWFAIFYMILFFVLMPVFVFLVSLGGAIAMYSVFIPIGIFFLMLSIINMMQTRFPKSLPEFLRTWTWLPEPMRSLKPYDICIMKVTHCGRRATSQHYAHVPSIIIPPGVTAEQALKAANNGCRDSQVYLTSQGSEAEIHVHKQYYDSICVPVDTLRETST